MKSTAKCPLSSAEVEHFLEWCFSTDPAFDDEPESDRHGKLRELIKDCGAEGLCEDVSDELLKFVLDFEPNRLVHPQWLRFPHDKYPEGDKFIEGRQAHCVCVIDGVVVDFTAKQFDIKGTIEYPVPYVWKF